METNFVIYFLAVVQAKHDLVRLATDTYTNSAMRASTSYEDFSVSIPYEAIVDSCINHKMTAEVMLGSEARNYSHQWTVKYNLTGVVYTYTQQSQDSSIVLYSSDLTYNE